MASRLVVIGEVNGQFRTVFKILTALHARNNFACAFIVGNLFAVETEQSSYDYNSDIGALLQGEIEVPLPVYFALGTRALPSVITEKLDSSNDELCHNLFFLGRRTTMKTSEGFRVVALGGQLTEDISAGEIKDKYSPVYSEKDAKILKGATSADVLITSEWPEAIRTRSSIVFNPPKQLSLQSCIADLDLTLRPRYHFTTSGTEFFEREPFFHPPSEDTDSLYPITRFISLASYGNQSKNKWIYAFTIDPTSAHPVTPPAGATACPLVLSDKKRAQPRHQGRALVYDDGSRGRRPHKRRKGETRGPLLVSDCFFCLANENTATHLVAAIGENSYITTAKGPLSTSETFPKLGFPCHMLIIPFAHQGTLGLIEQEERVATYAEMQNFRNSMNAMLESTSGIDYGSVTWELSKGGLPHVHWQYLALGAESIRKGLVEAAFKAMAENLCWPPFEKEEIGDGSNESSDFFRVMVWDPSAKSKHTSLILRFNERIRFHNQFGREVLGKLLRLDERIDWHDCGQTTEEEEQDVGKFKSAFKDFDFTL